jgi:hypothetical protein
MEDSASLLNFLIVEKRDLVERSLRPTPKLYLHYVSHSIYGTKIPSRSKEALCIWYIALTLILFSSI